MTSARQVTFALAVSTTLLLQPEANAGQAPAATSGVLRLTGGALEAVTRSDVAFATNGSVETGHAPPQIDLEWKGLILRRGEFQSGVPVDLSLTLIPAFAAKASGVVFSVLEDVRGRLVVRSASRSETWAVASGNFGSQAAHTNFRSEEGTLHLVLPLLLENGSGTIVGVTIAAVCSPAPELWSCSRASIVLEEMRRSSQPTAGIEAVLSSWMPRPGPAKPVDD